MALRHLERNRVGRRRNSSFTPPSLPSRWNLESSRSERSPDDEPPPITPLGPLAGRRRLLRRGPCKRPACPGPVVRTGAGTEAEEALLRRQDRRCAEGGPEAPRGCPQRRGCQDRPGELLSPPRHGPLEGHGIRLSGARPGDPRRAVVREIDPGAE